MARTLSLVIALGLLPASLPAQQHAPRVLVEPGACPFECCQYGEWTAIRRVPVHRAPDRPVAFAIDAGTRVTAATGYVRSTGTPFVVNRPHPPYAPGDRLVVYGYRGEGHFGVWFNGRSFTEDLGFSPYGGTGGTRCTDAKYCWGTLARELRSQWWVHLRLADGRSGWVRGSEGFEGQDACR